MIPLATLSQIPAWEWVAFAVALLCNLTMLVSLAYSLVRHTLAVERLGAHHRRWGV